jgi:hypothetical protein
MLIRTFFLVLVRGTRAQSFPKPFSNILYISHYKSIENKLREE